MHLSFVLSGIAEVSKTNDMKRRIVVYNKERATESLRLGEMNSTNTENLDEMLLANLYACETDSLCVRHTDRAIHSFLLTSAP